MPGTDLPPPQDPMTSAALLHRWPTASEKVELIHGVMVFTGRFDERDLNIARRTDPGRNCLLKADGGMEIHPKGPSEPAPLL
ncbi:hypothetical protein AB0I82_35230 [Streptomyces sp. NPDC050315]|uniref:hypothetical protein n=1 Tax=Streptomyces sp. NPDC050315 TaxID=3155039 RepID=UPI003426D362